MFSVLPKKFFKALNRDLKNISNFLAAYSKFPLMNLIVSEALMRKVST